MPLPPLPICGTDEFKLFSKLAADVSLKRGQQIDFDAMAIKWGESVIGTSIMPKIPVYLRVYHAAYMKSQRVKQASRNALPATEALIGLNSATEPHTAAEISTAASASGSTAPPFPQHPHIPQPPELPSLSGQPDERQVVGGTAIGDRSEPDPAEMDAEVKSRPRGKDKKPRAPRKCKISSSSL